DTGIGIPKEKQDKIFTEYYQVDKSTTRNYGGTGLGLAICKKLTELLNGTIKVEINSFNGTTFSIEIPYKIPEKTVLSDFNDLFVIDSSCITNKNVKILIVDDYKESINNFKSKLNFLGFSNIEIASSGYSALEQLTLAAESNKAFDMVFIDMQMPIMDGWRLASEINNNKKINSSKLFLLIPEGYTDKEAKMKILGWFNGYLYKPVKMNNLVELITEKQDEVVDLEVVPNEDFENTKKIKILAAEDHPVNRKLLTTFLKQFNSEVLEAENGKEALDIIQANHDVDIIFMDIQMPIINGIEATKEIRKLAYDGIIIACTANTDTQDFEEFQKAGMNDILVKPFKKQDIQNMINKWSSVINISATENHRRKKYSFVENIEFSDNSVNELWDKIDFLDTVSNDISLAQKLIDEYIAQTRILLMQAKDALYHNNFEELAKIAHTLKGSSSTISAKSLYSTAYQMEKYSKEELTTEVVNSISKFIALFTRFIKEAKHQKEDWQND
ncbi:MAG: response regulator, partial [Spirochaetaceae bacterium]|nr:response regulator [Spirochaetaceae bacterium]